MTAAMKFSAAAVLTFAALLSLATSSSSRETTRYRKQAFLEVNGGRSPDGRYSIAAHGEGDFGTDNFHLYLMGERGRKIGPLEEVKEIYSNAPSDFTASWSPNSHFVTLTYRELRNREALLVYRVERGRAFPVTGPTLIGTAAGLAANAIESGAVWPLFHEFAWKGTGHFSIVETGTLRTNEAVAKALAGVAQKIRSETAGGHTDPDWYVDFDLTGEGEIVEGATYVITSVKPRK